MPTEAIQDLCKVTKPLNNIQLLVLHHLIPILSKLSGAEEKPQEESLLAEARSSDVEPPIPIPKAASVLPLLSQLFVCTIWASSNPDISVLRGRMSSEAAALGPIATTTTPPPTPVELGIYKTVQMMLTTNSYLPQNVIHEHSGQLLLKDLLSI